MTSNATAQSLHSDYASKHDNFARASLRPPSRKSLLPDAQDGSTFFFKSYQTRNPLLRVVNGISGALRDSERESYGLTGCHCFVISSHSFNPDGCFWDCWVDYNARVRLSGDIVCKQGGFQVRLQCHKIMDPNDDENVSDDEYGETILAVDITLKLQTTKAVINKNELTSLRKLFDLICLDMWRVLSTIGFPTFAEGCQGKRFKEVYQLNDKMKSGQFGTVCLGTHRGTRMRFAIKIIPRKNLKPAEDAAVFNEADIISSLKHEYICSMIDFFVEPDCFFIVMELMVGGDLFDRLGTMKAYNENEARQLCQNLLSAISYCHEHNVAHCDLKPKNLLLVTNESNTSIKLADFGFATRLYAANSLTKQCGTPYFVAPEILVNNGYDEKADMWSVGVIAYVLLCGHLPFTGQKHLDLFKAIISGKYSFNDKDMISDDAKGFIKGLLVTNPSRRWSVNEALGCAWIRSNEARQKLLRQNSLLYVTPQLKGFNGRLAFKGAILKVRTTIYWRNIVAKRKSIKHQDSEKKESDLKGEGRHVEDAA